MDQSSSTAYDTSLEAACELIKCFNDGSDLELEGSLGTLGPVRFTSGVTFELFRNIHSAVSVATKSAVANVWECKSAGEHFATYYFIDGVRGRYFVGQSPLYVKKMTIARIDIPVLNRLNDLRIRLCQENLLKDYVPGIVEKVRLHERWSFEYKGKYVYDFTKVSEGLNKEDACESTPTFEVEIEVLGKNEKVPNDHTAHNLIEKLKDLLGRFDQSGNINSFEFGLPHIWKSQNQLGTPQCPLNNQFFVTEQDAGTT